MKIALIGYGKMGKIIEQLATQQGHEIVLRVTSANRDSITPEMLRTSDVAIEFSRPDAAPANIELCLNAGVPVVVGTTAWGQHLDRVRQQCDQTAGALFYASNFSIGVNIFFAINRQLAKLMATQPNYMASMEEIHHTQKLDAPSGTAVSLANDILAENSAITRWVNSSDYRLGDPALPITAIRADNVTGTHIVRYQSDIDSIEIKHEAFNRQGFAQGAILAAAWLIGKKGVYTMQDMLNLG